MKANWQTKKLGDVCEIINGSTPLRSNKNFWNHGDVSWFTIDDIREQGRVIQYTKQKITKQAIGKTSVRLLPPESILLCCTASVGEYAITKIPLTTNQQFNGLVVKDKEFLSPEFLFYFSSTLKDQLLGLSGKTTIDFIPISRLREIEIPVPLLVEQGRIVKILDEVFEKVKKAKENAEKNLQNTKELFESYLQNIFTNQGKDWEEKRLGEVCEMINRGVSPKYAESKGLCVLNQKCIRDHKINFGLARLHDFKNKKVSIDKYIQIGDVLVNSTGTGTLGRVAQVKELPTKATTDSHVTIVRPIKNMFYNDFFGYGLIFIEKEIAKRGDGCGGQTELARNTLKNDFKISYPKSLIEQKSIVKKLDVISAETKKLEIIYKQKLGELEELKKSVLKKAFKGELGLQDSQVTEAKNFVPSPYVRNQVHAAIIEQVSADGGWTTEVAVAKYDHLLQEVYGLSLGYQFQTQQFGPFDAQIKRLVWSGLGRNKWFAKRNGMIVSGSNIKALISKQSNLYHNAQSAMKDLSRLKVTKLNAEKVELLSTICHSIKETKSIALDKIRNFMSQWPTDGNRTKADKFPVEQIQKCLDFIMRNNLHPRLLQTL
jgi:type I restriction enzyme S subunit